jgi:hypothetical protein
MIEELKKFITQKILKSRYVLIDLQIKSNFMISKLSCSQDLQLIRISMKENMLASIKLVFAKFIIRLD